MKTPKQQQTAADRVPAKELTRHLSESKALKAGRVKYKASETPCGEHLYSVSLVLVRKVSDKVSNVQLITSIRTAPSLGMAIQRAGEWAYSKRSLDQHRVMFATATRIEVEP